MKMKEKMRKSFERLLPLEVQVGKIWNSARIDVRLSPEPDYSFAPNLGLNIPPLATYLCLYTLCAKFPQKHLYHLSKALVDSRRASHGDERQPRELESDLE